MVPAAKWPEAAIMRQEFISMQIGDRVVSSADGDDAGKIVDYIDPPRGECDIEVAWESGVRTPAISRDLATEAAPWAAEIIPVEGGYRAFESVADADTWRGQV